MQVALPRGWFDDTKGLAALEAQATQECLQQIASSSSSHENYLAHGAAGALLLYAQQEMRGSVRTGCLQVLFLCPEQHMQLDLSSIKNLEVVTPLAGRRGNSLFKMLNSTKTAAGARLLRGSLLQPLTDIATIEGRLDCVEELLQQPEMLAHVQDALGQLPKKLDAMCVTLTVQKQQAGSQPAKRIAALVNSILVLRNTLQVSCSSRAARGNRNNRQSSQSSSNVPLQQSSPRSYRQSLDWTLSW
jgi:DNA mismatch repair protein MSH4